MSDAESEDAEDEGVNRFVSNDQLQQINKSHSDPSSLSSLQNCIAFLLRAEQRNRDRYDQGEEKHKLILEKFDATSHRFAVLETRVFNIEAMEVRLDDVVSSMQKANSNITSIQKSIENLNDAQKEAERKAEQQWILYSKTIGESVRAEMKRGLEQLQSDLLAKHTSGDSATQLATEKIKNRLERTIEAGRAELEGTMCALLCGAADLLGFAGPADGDGEGRERAAED